jgi:hypothetical protein
MKNKNILILLGALFGFLGYSFYNYNKRKNAMDGVDEYKQKYKLTEIWNYSEMCLNPFDLILGDKTGFSFHFIDETTFEKTDDKNYSIMFSHWSRPDNPESLKQYNVERTNDIFKINEFDNSNIQTYTLNVTKITRTPFEIVDDWVKGHNKKGS